MGMIGAYRYSMEKRLIIDTTRMQGEERSRLMAGLAGPFLVRNDYSGLNSLVRNFMETPDIQEVTIVDPEGRRLVHAVKPSTDEQRIAVAPASIFHNNARLGEIHFTVYPEGMNSRLSAYALSALVEHLFIFIILAGILTYAVTRTVTLPINRLGHAVKDMIDRRDFTRRIETIHRDEIGDLAKGINYLIERLERFVAEMADISSRINTLNPVIVSEVREIKKSAQDSAEAVSSVSASVSEMSASIQSIAENAESLSTSAEETSSAIIEMNASNQEVAGHTNELTMSVEAVTSSVSEMIASILEVADHVEGLSAAAEQTSASAIQIESAVRDVEQTAQESAKLSQQVFREAQDIGATSIRETIHAMDGIKNAVSHYSSLVTRLGQRSQEIGKILGVIVDVAEKTNLLALNASILAAQAGEQGKGFSVVAEEIKGLADRTTASAQDIANLIGSVQKETKEAVHAMTDGLQAVEEGVKRSREADAALNKILSSSTRSAEMATTIERAMAEQTNGIKKVGEAIRNVKQMSEQIMTATHAQTKGTEMILNSTDDMRTIARQVQNAMTEQGRGGKQIAGAADNVTARAGAIAAGTREQRQSILQILESLERIQNLPRQTVTRAESMAAALETLWQQTKQLNREIVTLTIRQDRHAPLSGGLRFSVLASHDPEEVRRRFTPLAEYLSRATKKPVEILPASDTGQLLKDFEERTTHLAFLNPLISIEAQKKIALIPLATALRNELPYFRAAIVTRSDQKIARLEEIKGKRFAFGDKRSASSFMIPRALLAEAGVRLEDLREYAFLGHHDAVAKAVIQGEFDAGGLRETTAKMLAGSGLAIIKSSIEIPEKTIFTSSELDAATRELVRQALLALDTSKNEDALILGEIDNGYSGFVGARDADFEGMKNLLVLLQEKTPSA